MALSMRYHKERRFGDLLSRISADVNTLLQTVQQVLRDFVQERTNIFGRPPVRADDVKLAHPHIANVGLGVEAIGGATGDEAPVVAQTTH